jgi:hypothetical protein
MPAKAGIQNYLKTLDFRLGGNDVKGRFKTFYETINIRVSYFFRISIFEFSMVSPLPTRFGRIFPDPPLEVVA